MAFDVRDTKREIAPGYWHEFGRSYGEKLLTFCEENDFPFFAELGQKGCYYCEVAKNFLENIKVKKFLHDYNIVGCVGTYGSTGAELIPLLQRVPVIINTGGQTMPRVYLYWKSKNIKLAYYTDGNGQTNELMPDFIKNISNDEKADRFINCIKKHLSV